MSDEFARDELFAVVPNRLAAPFDGDIRPFLNVGAVRRAAEFASEWQRLSQYATLWEGLETGHDVQRDRTAEVVGLFAAIGEQIALARSALVECEARRKRRESHQSPGDEMCHRAFAELLAYYCIGAGHSLINLTGRMLALDARLHVALLQGLKTDMPPHSAKATDWLSCNSRSADRLSVIGRQAPIVEMAGPTVAIANLARSDAWQKLTQRRAADFHRHRPRVMVS